MAITHKIFPLVIYQGEVRGHKEFKNNNLESLRDYWFNGYKNESPENSGRIFVHKKYSSLFKSIKRNVDEYFDILNVNHKNLSYHVVKSWVGLHDKDTPELNPHNHNASDISFVYYLKSDDASDKFCAIQKDNPNEVVEGLFQTGQENLIKGFNNFNCNYYTLTPKEGTIIIFPSGMLHKTLKFTERMDERIVIAGDITITLKNDLPYHQASTHPSQWLEI